MITVPYFQRRKLFVKLTSHHQTIIHAIDETIEQSFSVKLFLLTVFQIKSLQKHRVLHLYQLHRRCNAHPFTHATEIVPQHDPRVTQLWFVMA